MEKKMARTEMEVGADGVAVITIINPPINCLSFDVMWSLKANFEEAIRRDDVKAIVLTAGQGPNFSGGFDIAAFEDLQGGNNGQKPEPKVGYFAIDVVTDIFEAARKPSVAAITGLVIGGGLELSMACHGRISTAAAQIALPELTLGFITGLGGTQRLPRLVGLPKALEMLLLSKGIGGEEAYKLGLVDAIVSPDELVETARHWALDIAESRKPWTKSLYRTDKLEPPEKAREVLKSARVEARKRSPNVQFPSLCIDVIEEGIVSGPRAGLWKESTTFLELLFTDTCKNLVHLLFAQRATTKVPGITDSGLKPRKIATVGIVGGGLTSSGIATALILNNYQVILKEEDENLLESTIGRVKDNLQNCVNEGKLNDEKCETALSLLTGVLDYERFKDVDMAIEARNQRTPFFYPTIFFPSENLHLKQQIFADLEKHCSPNCILASNTSTIDLNLIGGETKSQDRIVGAHFFGPAHDMPLLEIIQTQKTSPQAVVDLLDVAEKIHKTPIVVRNCTGFAVNRMLFAHTQAALLLVDHGLDVYKIDHACTKFGLPMGPFRAADLVGLGAAGASGIQYLQSYPERVYKSMLMSVMIEDKREGEASGKGFYKYDEKRNASPDPEIIKYVEKSRNMASVTPNPQLMEIPDEDIVEMLLFPVINEACRILDEGIAVKATDLDIATVMGMGFPAYRGGIMFWADSLGANYICEKLEEWSKLYGNLFKPCSYLTDRAAKGILLSSP
ncbi:unnamed protein product [Musa acuminata subsp. malaccensis]|uniref:(wild Malaysian banana) hypothetical protein n=1 Tax=Musa acuminata subsp. malaccensis TaxID=214687 RepID=A0A8D7AIU0_MUSAM|nr:unnamed protein product [Musa acuminata subsp. malaccensis]